MVFSVPNYNSLAAELSGFSQHLHQLPVYPAARPSPGTVSLPCSQPGACQQHTALQFQPARRVSPAPLLSPAGQSALNQQHMVTQLPIASSRGFPGTGSPSTGQPTVTQQNRAPPLQVVHHSAALFASTPTRPPLLHAVTPLTVNRRVNGYARAPAPHIRPFRPASTPGATFTSLPSDTVPAENPASSTLRSSTFNVDKPL